jgi:hypothetical protein
VVALFGKHHAPDAPAVQGGIFNFVLLKPDGSRERGLVSWCFSLDVLQAGGDLCAVRPSVRLFACFCLGCFLGVLLWDAGRGAVAKERKATRPSPLQPPPPPSNPPPQTAVFSYKAFELAAAAAGIHVRTGSECNPGACYSYLGVGEDEVAALAGTKEGCHDDVEYAHVARGEVPVMHGAWESVDAGDGARTRMVDVPLGSVRASLGYFSTFEDVAALAGFIEARYTDRRDEP